MKVWNPIFIAHFLPNTSSCCVIFYHHVRTDQHNPILHLTNELASHHHITHKTFLNVWRKKDGNAKGKTALPIMLLPHQQWWVPDILERWSLWGENFGSCSMCSSFSIPYYRFLILFAYVCSMTVFFGVANEYSLLQLILRIWGYGRTFCLLCIFILLLLYHLKVTAK